MIRPVDPLLHNVPIVDAAGRPTPQFSRLWMQARSVDEAVVSTADSVSGLETDLGTHAAATAGVHGIADTSLLVLDDDTRLTDARVPLPHAASHYSGPDALDLDSIPGTLNGAKVYGELGADTPLAGIIALAGTFGSVEVAGTLLPSALGINMTSLSSGNAPLYNVPGGAMLVANFDADLLDGQHGMYYLDRTNHTGTEPLSALEQGTAGQVLLAVTGAGPVYGQIDNSHVLGAAAIQWGKLDKTGSSLADLSTRSAADLNSGTLADGRLSSNVPLKNASNVYTARQSLSPADTVMLRMWNSAGTVDARMWDFRTILADGTFELRTISDAGVTQALHFDVPRAGGFRVRSGGLQIGTTEVITSARVFQNGTFGGSMRGAAIADADGTLPDITAKFNTLLAQRRTRGDQA